MNFPCCCANNVEDVLLSLSYLWVIRKEWIFLVCIWKGYHFGKSWKVKGSAVESPCGALPYKYSLSVLIWHEANQFFARMVPDFCAFSLILLPNWLVLRLKGGCSWGDDCNEIKCMSNKIVMEMYYTAECSFAVKSCLPFCQCDYEVAGFFPPFQAHPVGSVQFNLFIYTWI